MKLDEYTPEQANKELLELTIKAARRCAYDLRHAADEMPKGEFRDILSGRAVGWLTIFDPTNGPKDYRHRLHRDIVMLEMENERLIELLKSKGIDPDDPDASPI